MPITMGVIRILGQVLHAQDATNILNELARELFPIIGEHLHRRNVHNDPVRYRSRGHLGSGYPPNRDGPKLLLKAIGD